MKNIVRYETGASPHGHFESWPRALVGVVFDQLRQEVLKLSAVVAATHGSNMAALKRLVDDRRGETELLAGALCAASLSEAGLALLH